MRNIIAAIAAGVVLILGGSPAFAAGSSAVVGATVSTDSVHVQSTKGLSRVTIVFCDGSTLVSDSWDGEQLSADIPVSGTVEAVFIHSGANTTEDAQALLSQLAGADAVKGDSTGAIAFYNADACTPPTTTTTAPPPTTTTTEPPVVTTTTEPPVVTTTTIEQPAVIIHSDPAPPAPPAPTTDVEGVSLAQPAATPAVPTADLPFTGSNSRTLASFGALLVLLGCSAFGLRSRLHRTVA